MIKKLQLIVLLTLCLSAGLLAQEVVLTDEFDSGDSKWTSGWIDNATATVTVSIDNTSKLSGANSYKLAIVRGGDVTYKIQRNANCPLVAGYQYTLSFMAVADKDVSINALFELSGDPYTKRLNEIAQVTTTPQTYTYVMSASENVTANQVKLHFGGPANDNSTIWVDAITVTRIEDPAPVVKWGFLGNRIGNWKFTPGEAKGGAHVGGDTSQTSEWGAIRGEFNEPITATTSKAIVVTGEVEFEGAGIDVWSGLRYGLFKHDSSKALITTNVDSTRWSGSESFSHGYMFSPISGVNRVTDGASGGIGTQWIRVSGNYISTSTGSGPCYTAGVSRQKPIRAVADAGKYSFAFSVQPLENGTKEVRFYLIKGTAASSATSTYYFAGSFIDTTSIDPTFNGVVFAAHATGSGANPDLRGMKFTNVRAELGTALELPEAPWVESYVENWGFLGNRIGNWKFKPDPDGIIGNAGIGGDASLTSEWGAIRGEFTEPVTATTSKAIIVTGSVEFEGAGIDVWSGLRYGLFMHDSTKTLITTNVDSTRWSGSESFSHGYMFSPISGVNRVTDGASGGIGTQWIRVSGNYISTSTGSGPCYTAGVSRQKPIRAVADAGKYSFAFSVQPLADGTKEVRFYLIKGDVANSATSTYYFAGSFIDTTSIAPSFNGVVFAVHATGSGANPDIRGMKFTDVKVDMGPSLTLPEAPWVEFYVDQWGFIGNRIGGWSFIPDPDEIIGNAGMGGTAAPAGWAALRGGFIEAVEPTAEKAVILTADMELVGGGFQDWSSLRLGLFYSDSAGVVDTNNVWTGKEANHNGYLFIPHSGTNDLTNWQGINQTATVGAVVNGTWISSNGATNYALSADQQENKAVAAAGNYSIALSVGPVKENGSTEVRYYIHNADTSYQWGGIVEDTHSPLVTKMFNSFNIGTNNASTRSLKLTNVKVDMGDAIVVPEDVVSVQSRENGLPTEYALDQNYPNPFNPSTTISFSLPEAGNVSLIVYDILGRAVTELVKGNFNAGYYNVNFNASNLASGIYFYRITAGDFVSVKKLMLLK